ncbi:UNVERIFIED_CONTAM: hypothetical protein Sindi_0966000 [Sesamum indicum]
MEEGGQGLRDIATLNRALMTNKLCEVIKCERTSIWVDWIYYGRILNTSIWTVRDDRGSCGWRKLLRLRPFLRPMVEYHIRDEHGFYLWQDPWHPLGPLIDRFPRAPLLLGVDFSTKLSAVIDEGVWQWPPYTDSECLEILHTLPHIHGGEDRIIWPFQSGQRSTQTLIRLFDPPGLKVRWTSLHSGSSIVFCVMWVRRRPIVTFSFNIDLADDVLLRARNLRRFEHEERTPVTLAFLIVEDVRQRILSINLATFVSTCDLFRLWRIPWPVEGETN